MSNGNAVKKVLVIDDNPTIVELIKYAMNLQGSYQVIVAYDGVQGLERIFAEQPDCVIIDVKMPRTLFAWRSSYHQYSADHFERDDA